MPVQSANSHTSSVETNSERSSCVSCCAEVSEPLPRLFSRLLVDPDCETFQSAIVAIVLAFLDISEENTSKCAMDCFAIAIDHIRVELKLANLDSAQNELNRRIVLSLTSKEMPDFDKLKAFVLAISRLVDAGVLTDSALKSMQCFAEK